MKCARNPQELHPLFTEALNSGDVEGLAALYDPQGFLMTGRGACGADEIRAALARYVASESRIELTTRSVQQAGDTALLVGDWKLRRKGSDGQEIHSSGTSVEVVRRQPDGSWRYLIDLPYGVESSVSKG